MPDKEEALEVEGTVTQALANTRFRVRLDSGGSEVMAHVAGRMRKHFIDFPLMFSLWIWKVMESA